MRRAGRAGLRRERQRAERFKPRLASVRGTLRGDAPDAAVEERLRDLHPKRLERFRRRVERASADVEFRLGQALGWRGGVVLAWACMRGAITVAAAQTLPEDTPDRAQLVLIAHVVATVTLLLQG